MTFIHFFILFLITIGLIAIAHQIVRLTTFIRNFAFAKQELLTPTEQQLIYERTTHQQTLSNIKAIHHLEIKNLKNENEILTRANRQQKDELETLTNKLFESIT
jgi:hypothetical protein